MEMYPTEDDAIRYLEGLRWGDTPCCTRCGSTEKITAQKKVGNYWCGSCREYFTVRTGTPLERCKIDIRKFIYAAYLLMTARKGISSLQLSKELSVQQRTAWYVLHRLRVMCGPSKMKALHGQVEIDEMYLGGLEENKHQHKKCPDAQGGKDKQIILGMREREGRVFALPIKNKSSGTIHANVHKFVRPDSTVYTDENLSYKGMFVFKHESINHSAKEWVKGMAHTNGIESVWAVLQRGFTGTYHHFSKKHCRAYVNEFTFRLNEGNCERDTQDRLDDLFLAMVGKTITYRELTS